MSRISLFFFCLELKLILQELRVFRKKARENNCDQFFHKNKIKRQNCFSGIKYGVEENEFAYVILDETVCEFGELYANVMHSRLPCYIGENISTLRNGKMGNLIRISKEVKILDRCFLNIDFIKPIENAIDTLIDSMSKSTFKIKLEIPIEGLGKFLIDSEMNEKMEFLYTLYFAKRKQYDVVTSFKVSNATHILCLMMTLISLITHYEESIGVEQI